MGFFSLWFNKHASVGYWICELCGSSELVNDDCASVAWGAFFLISAAVPRLVVVMKAGMQ